MLTKLAGEVQTPIIADQNCSIMHLKVHVCIEPDQSLVVMDACQIQLIVREQMLYI